MGVTEQGDPKQAERKKRFLLVVDGNQRDLFTTGMLLQNFGYTVYTLHTGKEALEFLEVAVPALVILDIALSGTNGLELLRQIRKTPRTAGIPV
ncbi:MAG TPA: response regulator, partial [Nitrospirota bacterium]|nr:response regulator [Nitrospirota bacterium]